MTGEQRAEQSPSLPPVHAWKEPERWLNLDTGRPKDGIELMPVPIDERGFVKIDQFIANMTSELFVDGYEWPRDPLNTETRTDNHHFYFEAHEYSRLMNNGDDIPKQFRELATNVGRMPRQFHNAVHAFAEKPAMPERDAMHDYIRSYKLAHAAFKRLYVTAHETVNTMGLFSLRRLSVAEGRIVPQDELDSVGEDFLKTTFHRHFTRYSDAVERFRDTEGKEIVYRDHETIKVSRPAVVARKFGAIVNRKAIQIKLNDAA